METEGADISQNGDEFNEFKKLFQSLALPDGGREGQVLTLGGDGSLIWADPPVITVFGRTGEVEPKIGDYSDHQIVQAGSVEERIKAITEALESLKNSVGIS